MKTRTKSNKKTADVILPGWKASVGDDGAVAGGQQSEVVADRVPVFAVAFS